MDTATVVGVGADAWDVRLRGAVKIDGATLELAASLVDDHRTG